MRSKGMQIMRNHTSLVWLGLAMTLVVPQARATGIVFNLDTVFSGQSTPPAGPGPWTSASLLDISPGTVQLTVTNVGLSTGEFIRGLYLNLNPADNVSDLHFSLVSSHGSFSLPSISLGEDSFKADGDGLYDILLSFGTAHNTTFTVDDSVTYQITGIANLESSDFAFMSSPAGGSGPFYAAAHVQGTPPNNGQSCWIEPGVGPIPVPEPAAEALLALGAGLWLARKRSRA